MAGRDAAYYTGVVDGEFVTELPVLLTRELLLRGQQRFDIFCSPCHGRLGNGDGPVARRGFPNVGNYHVDRLRNQPVGYFFDVITNGYGNMYDLSDRVPVADRWAIAAYVQALQMSQYSQLSELPQEVQAEFQQAVQQ